ncbi:MAG: HupE/UreJ family protein, partial [Bacteroidia bacterium]
MGTLSTFYLGTKNQVVWLVRFFTIGHSISLGLAVLGWF